LQDFHQRKKEFGLKRKTCSSKFRRLERTGVIIGRGSITEIVSPQHDNIQYKQKKVLERCVRRGCENDGVNEVMLKYLKKSAPICENCVIEFRRLGFLV
jgi:hypothetical protein